MLTKRPETHYTNVYEYSYVVLPDGSTMILKVANAVPMSAADDINAVTAKGDKQ